MPLLPTVTPNIRDLKIGEYKVIIVDTELGTSQDLSQLVSSIQWDYDLDQPAEHYQISFVHSMNIAKKVKPGDRIKLYGWAVRPVGTNFEIYWELLKRIYIATTTLSSEDGGLLKATGYNVMWYLMRNRDTVMLDNETASQFIKRTADYYGIPLGTIADTGVVLEREPFMNRTIWDMWVSALSYTRDINPDARFLLQEKDGKVILASRQEAASLWNFHRGRFVPGPQSWENNPGNIFSATNTFSMENYSNVVRVYKGGFKIPEEGEGDPFGGAEGGTGPALIFQWPPQPSLEAGSDTEVHKYGMFVESVDLQMPGETALDLGNDRANAEQQGMKLYKKLVKFENTGTITTFNINTVRSGDAVHILDDITGLVGKYYVKSGSHMVTDQETSMSLTVNIEDELPEEYAARPQRPKTAEEGPFGPLTSGTPAGQTSGPSGRDWTVMSGSISIPDRYALAVAAGFKPLPSEEALKMTTISLFECGNCDMASVNASGDVGLWQINQIHWSKYGGPDILVNPRQNARAAFGVWSGVGGGEAGFRQWCVYPGGCGGSSGNKSQSEFDAKMAEVRALVASAGTVSSTGWTPVDMRGKLPTNHEANYGTRDLNGISGITIHYTAGPASQSAYQVAQYQTSEAARGQTGNNTPFPGLAYTLFVEQDGKTVLAHDLTVATWHASGGNRNTLNVSVCYAGDTSPNDAQITAMAQAIGWVQSQLGRKLGIEGHKDVQSTTCPGPGWPGWKADVVSRIPVGSA